MNKLSDLFSEEDFVSVRGVKFDVTAFAGNRLLLIMHRHDGVRSSTHYWCKTCGDKMGQVGIRGGKA